MNRTILTLFILVLTIKILAKERDYPVQTKPSNSGLNATQSKNKLMKFASDCEPASAQADLDINNVRTRILNGGDMWWDLSNARYEIPKVQDLNAVRKNSLFAGAIWIGGEDEGVLKLAAMTYRQGGSDFWPGPLNKVTGTTNEATCNAYDKIYKVLREDIVKHRKDWESGQLTTLSEGIKNWPGNGRGGTDPDLLAPFFDEDNDGIYDPFKGDYPVLQNECRGLPIDKENNTPSDQPDQMLWFVYNDRGNIHSETQGLAQGLELQTTAFAYATNDAINNMTFYTTRIINRGSNLKSTYFGQWVDPDLGNYSDDYVGCDVELSLGYCYNGDDNDEGILGYGLNPPSIGVDFFEGPKKDTIIDGVSTTYELGMSKFVYYDNGSDNFGDPQTPIHYYNYLRGKWKNGECLTRDEANGRTGDKCTNYLFPGTSDPTNSTNWTEKTASNAPADRRFLQTSGPFTLQQGAVNKVTVGVLWAKASSGGASGSLDLLKASSRQAQELFDNCFDILDGPDAPFTEVRELSNELVFMFNDTKRIESYQEVTKSDGDTVTYHFQGYRIYQLKNSSVNTGDLEDIDKARHVFSCDLKDSITRLINQPFDEVLGQPLPKLKIEGPNKGLVHSVSIREDAFATGSNKSLVNHKTYYYMIVSYAALPGHRDLEYLAGRKIDQFSAIPHQSAPEMGGVKLNGGYGDGPKLVRLEGRGNGGLNLELSQESVNYIMANGKMDNPEYTSGNGPINIKIIDPLKVPQGSFELILQEDSNQTDGDQRLIGIVDSATSWMLIKFNASTNDTIFSDYTLDYENEQLITSTSTDNRLFDWGMSVTISQVNAPGNSKEDETNGLISWEVSWEDNSKQWLTAISDVDNGYWYNWIRSGRVGVDPNNPADYSIHDQRDGNGNAIDQFEVYEKIWGGRIAPYRLVSRNIAFTANSQPERDYNLVQGVAYNGIRPSRDWNNINNLSSVDIVLTPDESKWSQCLVLELGEEENLNQGGAHKFEIRKHASINKNGTENPNEQGRTWFPGYAINVETGERLNIVLGEDSYQGSNNGRDLKWNPTDEGGNFSSGYGGFGGRHYIYVMDTDSSKYFTLYPKGPAYDGGNEYMKRLNGRTGDDYYKKLNQQVLYHAMWVIPSFMSPGYQMNYNENDMPVPPTEVKIRLRVKKPYQYFATNENQNNSNPRYRFNTNDSYADLNIKYGKQAMETVRLVPNPYFAYSEYENNPVENRVKITNLPQSCRINIYTIDGSLVRRIIKDNASTEVIWNLKNNASVPIASGSYLIHVDAGELGEKVIKWMGIMRELDLDSF